MTLNDFVRFMIKLNMRQIKLNRNDCNSEMFKLQ